jgi:hypothetical protein
MALVAYSVDIVPVACHIVPILTEEDTADSRILAVLDIPADMAD